MGKKNIEYRSKQERQSECREIISNLIKLKLDPVYEPVKELYIKLKEYIDSGEKVKVDIPFPDFGKRIRGVLAIDKKEQVWVKIELDEEDD